MDNFSFLEENSYTVTQINEKVHYMFENELFFNDILIKGEVSNFIGMNKSGHIYFVLKDENSKLQAAIFKNNIFHNKIDFKDGDIVYAIGKISNYVKNGTYQINIKKILKTGIGDLFEKKKKIKEKLQKEGLFEEKFKKSLPKFPSKIAIVTAKNSAAQKDLVFNIFKRWKLSEITIFNSLMQGEKALLNIINCLDTIDSSNKYDVIVLSRGGGSLEDLDVFDEEILVRKIFELKTPLISAIGHEINLSLTDLVSDFYVSTPTAAAELVVPNREEIKFNINKTRTNLDRYINNKILKTKLKLSDISQLGFFKNIDNLTAKFRKNLELLNVRIENKIVNILLENKNKLKVLNENLKAISFEEILNKGFLLPLDENKNLIKVDNIKIEDTLFLFNNKKSVKVKVLEVSEHGKK